VSWATTQIQYDFTLYSVLLCAQFLREYNVIIRFKPTHFPYFCTPKSYANTIRLNAFVLRIFRTCVRPIPTHIAFWLLYIATQIQYGSMLLCYAFSVLLCVQFLRKLRCMVRYFLCFSYAICNTSWAPARQPTCFLYAICVWFNSKCVALYAIFYWKCVVYST
jgi:hypothetical protein